MQSSRFLLIALPSTHLDGAWRSLLQNHPVAGVCLFRRNIESHTQLTELIDELRSLLGKNAVIAIDHEGGAVVRSAFLPEAPSAMALAAADDMALTHAVGSMVGYGLGRLGINLNLAPVLDVNHNPANPVIAERAFAADPQTVIAHARAWATGLINQGVAACGKHFPGHGDTVKDSHLALPSVDKPLHDLEACELLPFKALSAELPAIMSAHVRYPSLDAEAAASQSPLIIEQLLRQTYNYQGVIITDALNMGAITEHCGQATAAAQAMAAGHDLALVIGDTDVVTASIAAIDRARADRSIRSHQLGISQQRISALTKRFPSRLRPMTSPDHEPSTNLTAHVVDEVWEKALTLWPTRKIGQRPSHEGGRWPFVTERRYRLISETAFAGDGISEAGIDLSHLLTAWQKASRHPLELTYQRLDDYLATPLDDGAIHVYVSLSRKRTPPDWVGAVGQRVDACLALWNPYVALDWHCPTLISYGQTPGALRAVARFLVGDIAAVGHFPG